MSSSLYLYNRSVTTVSTLLNIGHFTVKMFAVIFVAVAALACVEGFSAIRATRSSAMKVILFIKQKPRLLTKIITQIFICSYLFFRSGCLEKVLSFQTCQEDQQ